MNNNKISSWLMEGINVEDILGLKNYFNQGIQPTAAYMTADETTYSDYNDYFDYSVYGAYGNYSNSYSDYSNYSNSISFLTNPTDQTVLVDETATFSVTVNNSQNITGYQWYIAESLTGEGTPITDATSSTYSVVGTFQNHNRYFYCKITSSTETITSSRAKLSVNAPRLFILNDFLNMYDLKAGDRLTCPYSGKGISKYFPKGKYIIECFGAQGGYSGTSGGGLGAHAKGTLTLDSKTLLHFYVGGEGNRSSQFEGELRYGGFNGGGHRFGLRHGGGGATDVRIKEDSLYSRVIVAGGGGSQGALAYPGGNSNSESLSGFGYYPEKGEYNTEPIIENNETGTKPGFGFGGIGTSGFGGFGGAGGGGWYGGRGVVVDTSQDDELGGEGGSSYVYTEATKSEYPLGCSLNDNYLLTDTDIVEGQNTGNGKIYITILEIYLPSYKIFIKNEDRWMKIQKETEE